MAEIILGLSAYYHDSAAAIIVNGKIIAACQEERFTRIRHDNSFPISSIKYVLKEAGISIEQLSLIVFYEKPFLKFERIINTYYAFAPKGIQSFIRAIPIWIMDKLFMKKMLIKELSKFGPVICPLYFSEHHLSHAASAFFPSPYEEAAILTIDGVGEWPTTTIGRGKGNSIEILEELCFPHSVGLLYSAFTSYIGFRVNSGEYKLMGLAPYGNLKDLQTQTFIKQIKENLVDIKYDGSLLLNMKYFNFATGLEMVNKKKWKELFGIDARIPESVLTQDYMNLAYAIQHITEEIILKLAVTAKNITGCKFLTMAGGVALNCVANSKILQKLVFTDIWVQPAAGDAGGALGAALAGWYIALSKERVVSKTDSMQGAYLGPEFSDLEIKDLRRQFQAVSEKIADFEILAKKVAILLDKGNVIGWFQGRMEFGPRALGNRSILGDARSSEMQKKMNIKIKGRESFRPFGPAILEEDASKYFNCLGHSPYMLMVYDVHQSLIKQLPPNFNSLSINQRLYWVKSTLPAITHIDFSARLQTVNEQTNKRFYRLISAYKKQTGCPVLVNTSFNVRGEPIVCTPSDAYKCFMTTAMDYLVIGNFIFKKELQPLNSEKYFDTALYED